jgi:PleD family two-component response regulator
MRDCYAQDASLIATMILERIAAVRIPADYGSRRVTASLGIACSARTRDAAARALAAADRACYVAKHGGRNRFAIASDSDDRTARLPSALVTHASI